MLREKSGFALRRFVSSMLFLHAITFLLHLTELMVNLGDGKVGFSLNVLFQIFLHDAAFIAHFALWVFPFYLIIYWASDFSARMLLGLLLMFTISISIGLMQYFLISNMLLGADLWNYSLHDIRLTVQASTSISWWQLILFPLVIGGAMRAHYALQQFTFPLTASAGIAAAYGGAFLLLSSAAISLPGDVNQKNLVLNKGDYFLNKTIAFVEGDHLNSPYMQQELLASAGAFPFQHLQSRQDELGDHLVKQSPMPPNFVFVIVEGLGKTFTGPNAEYEGCMPFLDSLSGKSLYWTNFLSTTGRTFGVLPSLLGSLPYGKSGFMEEKQYPNHTTLLRLLKQNGYHTSFYYGGDAAFDGQQRFLQHQQVDFILDEKQFPTGYEKIPANKEGFSWGYPDGELFRRSLELVPARQPYASVYLTVTTHEPFVLPHPEKYNVQLQQFISKYSDNRQVADNKEAFRTLMYADDAIRYLITSYQKRPEYKNTIFIITGDHRMIPVKHKNEIDRYHVPLLIYSPMVKDGEVFKSLCSHADVTPSLVTYLQKKYQLSFPDSVHWLGKGLTFGSTFSSDKHLPIMRNKGDISEYVFGKYFITDGALQNLSDNLDQAQNRDQELTQKVQKYLEQFKLLNEYVIQHNKLYSLRFNTKAPQYAHPANSEITLVDTSNRPDGQVYTQPEEPKREPTPAAQTTSGKPPKLAKTAVNNTIKTDEALKAAQDYMLRHPDDADAYYKLGLQHLKLGNLSWAKANFEKAIALNYKNKQAYEGLIELELQRNDKEAARSFYYKALGVFSKDEFEPMLRKIKAHTDSSN